MKKFFAIFMSLLLVLTMIPAMTFAASTQSWKDMYQRKPGDVVAQDRTICAVDFQSSTDESIDVHVEVSGVTEADAEYWKEAMGDSDMTWTYDDGTLRTAVTADYNHGAYISSPVLAVVDEVNFNEAKNILEYKLHKIDAFNGYFAFTEDIVGEDESLYELSITEDGLTINVNIFEDDEHEEPVVVGGNRVDDTKTCAADENVSYMAPVAVTIDALTYDEEKNELTFTCRRNYWNKEEIFFEEGDLLSEGEEFFTIHNYQSKKITVEYIVYHDKELTEPVEKEGYYYKEVIPGKEYQSKGFVAPEEMIYAGYVDKTREAESKVTLQFYLASAEISEADYACFNRVKAQAERALSTVNEDAIALKIADPKEMAIDGYDERDVMAYIADSMMLSRELGLDSQLYDEKEGQTFRTHVSLWGDIYTDKEMTQRAEAYDEEEGYWSLYVEPGKTYYMDLCYLIHISCGDRVSIDDEVRLGRPIEISYEYVPVGENTAEVEQIKKIGGMQLNYIVEDLCWINTLVTAGFDAYIPSLKNAEAFLKAGNRELYDEMIGGTRLELVTEYGRAGDAFSFIGETAARPFYYVDDVFYGTGGDVKYRNTMYIGDVLYVPEGTNDRAAVAEKRVNDYLGGGACEAEISRITDPMDMLDLWMATRTGSSEREWLESQIDPIRDKVKAAYFTKHGVAFYSHETSTAEEYFLTSWRICSESEYADQLFDESVLEEVGTLEYIATGDYDKEFTDVKAYAPYKLTLTNTDTDQSHDYLYAIGIGSEDQLREPYAEWKDKETNIITKGENGYVPFDAYTKIRVIKDGKEIKFIQDKVGKDKKVHAYDINAYTNFKGGKLEDLGDGLMKVMIPLGVLSEDGVKAHHVDNEGNVQDLEFTIEEYDGKKYVCFITNHFSTYAISGMETAGADIDSTVEASDDPVKEPVKDTEVPDTGDKTSIMAWILTACICSISVLRRRRMNR